MTLTNREAWGLIHGPILGGFLRLAIAGGLAQLYALRPRLGVAGAGTTGRTTRTESGLNDRREGRQIRAGCCDCLS
jgi:hypothetical protein